MFVWLGKQQLLAVGDGMGTLHVMEVPWNLRHPSANEVTCFSIFVLERLPRSVYSRNTRLKLVLCLMILMYKGVLQDCCYTYVKCPLPFVRVE